GLDRERARQAVNVAAADCLSLYQTRLGAISMWKGVAGANSARQGVLAGYLAAEGMTGPEAVFEGAAGLWAKLGILEWPRDDGWRTLAVQTKVYPAQFLCQSGIEAALALHGRGVRAATAQSVVIRTFEFARVTAAAGHEKWHPATRGTADHSLPYL